MTDTQESVKINQVTNNQGFVFLRRSLKSLNASECFICIIAVVVVIGAMYFYHAIKSLEARFETTVETILDKTDKRSRAFSEEAIKTFQTNMVRELNMLRKQLETHFETFDKILDKRENGSRAFIEEAIKTSETNMVRKFDMLRGLTEALEALLDTSGEKILDKREKGSTAFIEEAIKTCETNMVRKFDMLRKLIVHKNCAELYKSGKITSGVYMINPDDAGPDFAVFCDQKTDGGGWTLLQNRLDGSVTFDRGWSDYKNGFGDLSGEFWLGLNKIHRLTKSSSKLRVDLEDFEGKTIYAKYDIFAVATESKKYQLSVGKYSGYFTQGTAGDSLTQHHGHAFSTKDQDNDKDGDNCAEIYKGGWWYHSCYHSNLNGVYRHRKDSANALGVAWNTWKGKDSSLKRTELKIRPVEF